MEKRTADVNYACACSRARVPGGGEMRMEELTEKAREKERERERKKRDRTATERRDIYHALTNSASIARACARVYGRT